MTDLQPPHRRSLLKGVAVVAGAMAVPMMVRTQPTPTSLSNLAVQDQTASCWRRLNIEPPCRFNIEPGWVANS